MPGKLIIRNVPMLSKLCLSELIAYALGCERNWEFCDILFVRSSPPVNSHGPLNPFVMEHFVQTMTAVSARAAIFLHPVQEGGMAGRVLSWIFLNRTMSSHSVDVNERPLVEGDHVVSSLFQSICPFQRFPRTCSFWIPCLTGHTS